MEHFVMSEQLTGMATFGAPPPSIPLMRYESRLPRVCTVCPRQPRSATSSDVAHSTVAAPRPTVDRTIPEPAPAARQPSPAKATTISSTPVHRYCGWPKNRASGRKWSPTTRQTAGATSPDKVDLKANYSVAGRHFGKANIVFMDGHVAAREAVEVNKCLNYWDGDGIGGACRVGKSNPKFNASY